VPVAKGSRVSRVVIVGAGIGGLAAALLLGREGHDVTVFERDPEPVPSDPDEMWSSWPRRGTPQARLGHTFLAGTRALLAARLPDVLDAMLDAGAQPWDLADEVPGEPQPEDAELTSIMVRRPVFEGVLRRICERESSVVIHRGVAVTGLVTESDTTSAIPRVVGVELRDGPGVGADVTVVAGGRSLPIVRWLSEIGCEAPRTESDPCGFNCYTRYFRLRDPAEKTATRQLRFHHEPGYGVAELIGADNGTFATEIAMPTADRDFHALRDPAIWMAVARSVPPWREWLDPQRSEPITPTVDIMGQERNTNRQFAWDGRPLALGVHVIGDARCQTDSLFAWGCGNALLAATALTDAVAGHAHDAVSQALVLEDAVETELYGRYVHARERDRTTMQRLSGNEPPSHSVTRIIDEVLYPATKRDNVVYRAVMRWELQLDPANALADNHEVIQRARSITAQPFDESDGFPSREELVVAIRGAT
jgi:2-polyprenyl-6-methoxyphenol hydroxylase-like FAD-dependent oxidoreductase